jgi:hypothetical protein
MKPAGFAAACAVALLVSSLQARQPQSPVEKPFAKGGTIHMRLAAGGYKIAGRHDERIRVSWRANRPEDAAHLKADTEIQGHSATIVTSGFRNGVEFTIEVPFRSDLDVELTAGDLEVRGVEGNKKIESWAGDVNVDIGQPEQYKRVDASVRAGDLNAPPFKVSTGGLLRSFSWTGSGPYSLSVKLFAGDLNLR